MQTPHLNDSTRSWIEQIGRENKLVKPQVLLRIATDTNYMNNYTAELYNDHPKVTNTKAVMNLALPGMRIPGLLNWSVTESSEQVTQTASFESLNVLPVSQTQTSLTSDLPGRLHSKVILASYVANSEFVVEKVAGDINVGYVNDSTKDHLPFREERVKYRTFQDQSFTVSSSTGFPSPAIPNDDDNDVVDDVNWASSDNGAGSYFIQIDNEVIRVSNLIGNTFYIPAGGRAVNGVLEQHLSGATVKLLGFGPWTGDWTAMGYLNVDDFKPQQAILRPGTCLVSYEGYGNIVGPLSHKFDAGRNYQFTGYWFVKGVEPSLGEDGVAKVKVDLVSAGRMFEGQAMTPHLLQRMRNKFGQWRIGEENETIWGAADHKRNIPGDWVDYNSWDPSLRGSYPLTISTELAQHKAYMEHMSSTENGARCEICMEENKEWLKKHDDPVKLRNEFNNTPDGPAKDALGERLSELSLQQARATGRHIYKESIRVIQEEAGPIKTYIRLMATIAAASWDHPAYGTELAQRFTKIPNKLFDNIRNVNTGLVFNGQLEFELASADKDYEFTNPTYDDTMIVSRRRALTCPFTATYDRAPFSQPMMDLAEVNGAKFWVNREGYPVFVPRDFTFRPAGKGKRNLAGDIDFDKEPAEWFASYGASISSYSHSIDPDAVITQCIVTGNDAMEESNEITIYAGGTGWIGNERVNYSPLGGNKDGLALTAGVQQVDSVSMDNLVLGLDWNTKPETWGLKQEFDGDGSVVLNAAPPLYDGAETKSRGDRGAAVKRIQATVRFFMQRGYIAPLYVNNKWYYPDAFPDDGKFSEVTEEGVKALHEYLESKSGEPGMGGLPALSPTQAVYNRTSYKWVKTWLSTAKHFIKFDIFWYTMAGLSWDAYVAAIAGLAVPFKKKKSVKNPTKGGDFTLDTPNWVLDDKGMQQEVSRWHKTFAQSMINAGNRRVDDSINKATARSLATNMADPRIQPGDVIWCEIPGFLGSKNILGQTRPPFHNGIYVNSITRTADLTTASGSYTATYSGYRFRGNFRQGLTSQAVDAGYEF